MLKLDTYIQKLCFNILLVIPLVFASPLPEVITPQVGADRAEQVDLHYLSQCQGHQ